MTKYAVIHRPAIDTSVIGSINKEYDPHYGLVGPHATLVFPFELDKADEGRLISALKNVAANTEPFDIRLNDMELAWDKWLFLTPTTGRSEVVELHDSLYKIPQLATFLREDIPFVPHVSLGHFAKPDSGYDLENPSDVPLDEERYNKARIEIDKLKLDYKYLVSSIELISIAEDFKSTATVAILHLSA